MATFADYDDNEVGDDNSSVTICPDAEFEDDANSIHSPISNCQNGNETPTPASLANAKSSTNSRCASSQSKTKLQRNNGSNHNADFSSKSCTKRNDSDATTMESTKNIGSGGGVPIKPVNNVGLNACASNSGLIMTSNQQQQEQPEALATASTGSNADIDGGGSGVASNTKNLLLCRRFKDAGDSLRNFTSLPLFIYATSPSTHATSADGVGVAQVAVKAAVEAAAAANLIKVYRSDIIFFMTKIEKHLKLN